MFKTTRLLTLALALSLGVSGAQTAPPQSADAQVRTLAENQQKRSAVTPQQEADPTKVEDNKLSPGTYVAGGVVVLALAAAGAIAYRYYNHPENHNLFEMLKNFRRGN